jgi:D-alanyl-D-alanine-carboxypeptidase/D-alanyl-D-alanine-endopeptidase
MLSRVGEGSYESVLKRRVLQPLGMHDTAVTLDEGQRKRFLDGHDGAWHVVPHWDNAADLAGVGGLRSSIADMARFAEAMAGRSRTPLEQAIELATKPQRSAQGVISLGLAWHVSDRGSARVAWHNGGTAGFRSMIAVDRRNGRAAVVLVDGQGQFDDLAMHLVDDSYALHRKRVAIAFDPRKLEDYVGRYEISSTFSIRMFVQDGRLMTQGTNQPAFELFAEAPDRFFARIVDAQVAFRRNADGKVEALTLFQAGREVPAPRVSNTP